jgi:hypothetical protein
VASISSDALVSRRDHPLTNDLSDTETVMLDIERGTYFGLQDVGKAIWEALAMPTTIDAICADLTERYDVDVDTCRQEVRAFLDQLHEQDLIQVNNARPAP